VSYQEFLVSPFAHLAPGRILEGLSTDDAERTLPGVPHSIADVVAHLAFWQDWFYDRCAGRATPMPTSAAIGWPEVPPGSWPQLRDRFLERLDQLAEIGEPAAAAPVSPPIEFAPLARYSVGDALMHVATHNSHHLGQIILLRQLLGLWPPPAGSWTW
jgi:uncharacterized damage-inducible protein DinB